MISSTVEKIILFFYSLVLAVTVFAVMLIFLFFSNNRFYAPYPGDESYLFRARQRIDQLFSAPESVALLRVQMDLREALQARSPGREIQWVFARIEPRPFFFLSSEGPARPVLVRALPIRLNQQNGLYEAFLSIPWDFLRGVPPHDKLAIYFFSEAAHLKTAATDFYSAKIVVPHPYSQEFAPAEFLGRIQMRKSFPFGPPPMADPGEP